MNAELKAKVLDLLALNPKGARSGRMTTGRKLLGIVLIASVAVMWCIHSSAHAQPGLPPGQGGNLKTAVPSDPWRNKTFTRFTYEEDIKDTLRAVAKVAGLPITFGDGITETVTMEFKNMPLKDAFDFLINQFDLEYTMDAHSIHVYKAGRGGTQDVLIPLDTVTLEEARLAVERFGLMKRELKIVFDEPTNSMFVTGPMREIANVQRLISSLETARKKKTEVKPEIRYFPLRYAKVNNIQLTIGKTQVSVPGMVQLLTQLVNLTKKGEETTTKLSIVEGTRRVDELPKDMALELKRAPSGVPAKGMIGVEAGTITSDPRANTIIIRDYPDKLEEYAKIIKQLDQPVKMVKMDVIIVEAGKDFAREVGVGWAGYKKSDADRRRYFPATSGTARDVFDEQYGGQDFTALNLMPLLETAAGAPITSYGIAGTFLYSGAQWNLLAVLSAAETKGLSRTINKSSIITMDNMQAIIEAKTTVTYKLQTGGDNPTVESRDIDAGIVLTVTPHVVDGDGGMVEMVVKAERSSFLATKTDDIPNKATTTLTTQAIIGNAATLVVGGLFDNRYQVGETGIPCLMNIPVAGYLFKTASARDPKSNILFFMCPTIISMDSIPYEGPGMKETVERGERELRQIDPERQKTLIEKH
jgi:type III secretion protein C